LKNNLFLEQLPRKLFSDAKKKNLDKVTKQFFFYATRNFFLLQEKKSLGKKKTVLSFYQEEFSWHQKKNT